MIQSCYISHQFVDTTNVSEDFTLLVHYLKALAPTISAGGLFDINRQLLTSFVALTISYSIILLQSRHPWQDYSFLSE